MTIIDDVRLPVDIERGAAGGPGFNTGIVTLGSGSETRNANWSVARSQWNVGYGVKKRDDLEEILAFFHARRGRWRGFRFKNWLDFSVKAGPVGAIAGQPLKRQLIRFYDDPVLPYTQKIFLPVNGTLKVYKDNVLMSSGYTVGSGGVLTFDADPGVNVKTTFEYDIPVRFDIDNLAINLNTFMEGSVPAIPIVELR
jgi:uncharacterized protein (TIGR02217 family)